MNTITLHTLTTPEKKIQAVKALRCATGMGLRETLQVCNNILGKTDVSCPSATGVPTPQTVGVYNNADMGDLRQNFVLTESISGYESNHGIDPNDVMELLFEALAEMDSSQAAQFRASPAYQRVRPKLTIA